MLSKTNPILKSYMQSEKSDLTAQELVDRILGEGGIYSQIETRWNAYAKHQVWHDAFLKTRDRGEEPHFLDEEGTRISGARALDPGPTVNKALSELVDICLEAYGEGVVKDFFAIAEANPDYREKLKNLPFISAYSEGEMEKYYAQKALDRLEERHNGHVVTSDQARNEIKSAAERRVIAYLESTGQNYTTRYDEVERMAIAIPAQNHDSVLADDIKKARRLLRLDEAIKPFPYTHNYEHLAYGEKFLLENPAGHGNFPKHLQTLAQKLALPAEDPEGKSEAAKEIKAKNPDIFGVENLNEKYMTFVGSGALPLTGFVNHIISGCKVNLIDVDPKAVELSQKLRTHLEFLGVLEKDAISVYTRHGNQVHYGGPRENDDERLAHRGERFVLDHPHYNYVNGEFTKREHEDVMYIPTDMLYIASLIPTDIKKSMMKNLEENKLDPVPVSIVRSARGLSSILYEPIHEAGKDVVGGSAYYHEYGSIIPKRHTMSYGNPHTASAEGYASPVSITALISDDNVNTAHIYYRSGMPLLNSQAVFLPGSVFDEQAQKDLGLTGRQVDYTYLTEHGPALLRQMEQELRRHAEGKGITPDTTFLDPANVEKAGTSAELIEAYRDIGRRYTEAKQQLGI